MQYKVAHQHVKTNFPEYGSALLYDVSTLAKIVGVSRGMMGEFIRKRSIPGYAVGKRTKYCLPEIVEAINEVRCK